LKACFKLCAQGYRGNAIQVMTPMRPSFRNVAIQ
jgi:hypothetical protein